MEQPESQEENQDVIEAEKRSTFVGQQCQVLLRGQKDKDGRCIVNLGKWDSLVA